uniref:Uncharacterized protein n=1 Tax=Romanomermis culicivorax TaxID=13658 RepID=A0A915JGY8_ROMCU
MFGSALMAGVPMHYIYRMSVGFEAENANACYNRFYVSYGFATGCGQGSDDRGHKLHTDYCSGVK